VKITVANMVKIILMPARDIQQAVIHSLHIQLVTLPTQYALCNGRVSCPSVPSTDSSSGVQESGAQYTKYLTINRKIIVSLS